ncbi:FecR family protein [Sphingobacterium lactis]|uniref:FecR family protein n=1 Tax=Sphingobacterium lactis TaxID=797291 RepID=UPI003DA44B6F
MIRYQQGKATLVEQRDLLTFLENSTEAERDEIFNDIHESVWDQQLADRDDSLTVQKDFAEILAKIPKSNPVQKKSPVPFWKYAAAVLLLSFSIILYKYYLSNPTVEIPKSIHWSSKSTIQGQKTKIILSDSSIVYLAGGSTLSWPDKFENGRVREVKLTGEAFFEVKRDTTRSFVVHTQHMRTEVLGTSFNIYAYPEDKNQTVSVRTGKVRVSTLENAQISQSTDLTVGMVLTYHKDSQKISLTKEEDPSAFNGWITNKITFQNAGLIELSTKLSRYYKLKIHTKNNCKKQDFQINAKFDNLPIHSILDQLKVMTGNQLNFEIHSNNEITLWRKGCR